MKLTENALEVLRRRYFIKDEQGKPVEDAPGLFRRVAETVAAVDLRYDPQADVDALSDTFYHLMAELTFMPNSPTLMNAGRPLGQLSACFVLPIGDSMEEIFDTVKNAALIHKSGGGTGFSFSRIRESGAMVNSTGGVASGPISFMRVFNAATDAVKQGGTRRGANMGLLRVDHPDIMEFIHCKADLQALTNFNISVALTEEFMQAVEQNASYPLRSPRNGSMVGEIQAAKVFDQIVEMAWRNGEPGIVFLDRINRANPVPQLGQVESTNPCGEQPLLPYESCNLGSVNLTHFAPDGQMDWDGLRRAVRLAVHFLDNVIDANHYPLPQIERMTLATRKIGLGVMGFADLLMQLGVPYNSDQAVTLAGELMAFINREAWAASRELAARRGPFPAAAESIFAGGEEVLPRNATVTTIAPTGTISILCGASSGIEPLFAISFIRNVMDGTQMVEVHPYFEKVARQRGFYSQELMARIAGEGTLQHMEEIPEDIRRVFVTAHDISPEYHIRMQAAFQQHTDNAVSKTVNFPHDATQQQVREAFTLAWQLGCKGVTIYRDGSRQMQVLNIGKVDKAAEAPEAETQAAPSSVTVSPRERPATTWGFTEKVKIGCGNLYVTVNFDENGLCEVFTNLGRAGGCPSQSEATSRLLSTALRSGLAPEALIEQLRGIRCLATMRRKNADSSLEVLSCPDAIGRVLQRSLKMRERMMAGPVVQDVSAQAAAQPKDEGEPAQGGHCPECGSALAAEGGCVICRGCGYSRCG